MEVLSFRHMSGDEWQLVAAAIGRGGLVCLPTDTVYGIACDPANQQATGLLYETKGRDPGKPVSLMFADPGQLRTALPTLQEKLWQQAEVLLTSAVTVILPTSAEKNILPAVADSLGARIVPSRFVEAYGALPLPLAMTSANISGEREPLTVDEIPAQIIDACEVVVDAGPCELGRPTSVVDLRPSASGSLPEILREGALDRDQIERLIGKCA